MGVTLQQREWTGEFVTLFYLVLIIMKTFFVSPFSSQRWLGFSFHLRQKKQLSLVEGKNLHLKNRFEIA